MTLSSALVNAFSGLRANTRAANLVSTNISNATTESYGRRSLALSPAAAGLSGGVRVDGVVRHVDPVLISDRRLSDAARGEGDARAVFAGRMEDAFGTVQTAGSLVGRVMAFENALLTAASNPASTQRLTSLAQTAESLTRTLHDLSAVVQEERQRAETAIGQQVTRLNDSLARLHRINEAVVASDATGADVTSLLDERQRLLDGVSEIVPLRVVPRDRGEIAIFTRGGATLLDGPPTRLGFDAAPAITASSSLSGGLPPLNRLTVDGRELGAMQETLFGGGTLAAAFAVRDEDAVQRQAELDGVATELVVRFQSIDDATLQAIGPPDAAGLFIDPDLGMVTPAGPAAPYEQAFDPAVHDATGLATRISVHPNVRDPATGSVLNLRQGLYADDYPVTPALEVGDATVLNSMIGVMADDSAAPISSAFQSGPTGVTGLVTDLTSTVASTRVRAEDELTFLAAKNTALREAELADGVDTDAELQRLMQIEQHYAANARVMSTVDELMQRLLQI